MSAPRRSAERGAGPTSLDVRDLPHPLTFFLSAAQRRRVLAALARLDPDRATALRRALGLCGGAGGTSRVKHQGAKTSRSER